MKNIQMSVVFLALLLVSVLQSKSVDVSDFGKYGLAYEMLKGGNTDFLSTLPDIDGLYYGNSLLNNLCSDKESTPAMVKALLDAGADVNARGSENETALIVCAEYGRADLVPTLLKAGADVNALKDRIQRGVAYTTSRTALMTASRRGYIEVVKLLLKAGADIDIKDSEGAKALFWAVESNVDIVKLLVNKGADVNHANAKNVTPLMIAATRGKADIVEYLILQGAALKTRNQWGQDVYYYARNRPGVMTVLNKYSK